MMPWSAEVGPGPLSRGLLLLSVALAACGGDSEAARLGADALAAAQVSDEVTSAVQPEFTSRRVWAGTQPDFYASSISPDGRYMSLVDWSAVDVGVLDLGSGQIHRLTNVEHATDEPWQEPGPSVFSPDGRRVAYIWFIGPDVQVRVVEFDPDAAGVPRPGAPDVLFHNPEISPYQLFDWSPDGRHVVVKAYTAGVVQLALISTTDGTYRTLKSLDWREPLRAAFSPDGRYLAYDLPSEPGSTDRDIHVVALDGASDTPIVEGPAVDRLLGWDGDGVLYHSDRGGTPGIWRLPMSEGRPADRAELLRADVVGVEPLGFGIGGYYYGVRVNPIGLYTVETDIESGRAAGSPVPVEHPAHIRVRGSDWSPGGDFLAYSAFIPGVPGSVIVIRSGRGEDVQTLRLDLSVTRHIRWMPDRQALIVHATDGKGRSGFHRVDLGSGTYASVVRDDQLDEPPATGDFDISPDGRKIYFAAAEESATGLLLSLVAYTIDSGTTDDITPPEWKQNRVPLAWPFGMISVSPDGTTLALAAPDTDPGSVGLDRAPAGAAIGTMPVAGGPFTVLARSDQPQIAPEWAPDGRAIVFSRRSDEGKWTTWTVSAEDGEPRPREILMQGDLLARRGLRLHPDGRRLTFFGGDPRGEVWVLDGRDSRRTDNTDRSSH